MGLDTDTPALTLGGFLGAGTSAFSVRGQDCDELHAVLTMVRAWTKPVEIPLEAQTEVPPGLPARGQAEAALATGWRRAAPQWAANPRYGSPSSVHQELSGTATSSSRQIRPGGDISSMST